MYVETIGSSILWEPRYFRLASPGTGRGDAECATVGAPDGDFHSVR